MYLLWCHSRAGISLSPILEVWGVGLERENCLDPFDSIPPSALVMQYKGNGFVFSKQRRKMFHLVPFCEKQSCSLHHTAHFKLHNSYGFHKLQSILADGSLTHLVVVRGLPVWLFCKFSNIALEKFAPGYAQELYNMKGRGFFLAKRGCDEITSSYFNS